MSRMVKTINKILIAIITIVFVCTTGIVLADENGQVKVVGAVFEHVSNVKTVDLGYGITHIKDVAKSTKKEGNELLLQSVNVLEVPSREDVRVVNWTFTNSSGWTKQTVRAMANDFENKNPGWVVIAAVNGDFFDINGTDKALPYQTGGVTVSDGETYRPITNGQTIGFKNDGGDYPLVAEKNFQVSAHFLNIYNENDEIVYSQEVKHFNEVPAEGEIAIWYSYKNSDGLTQYQTLPAENSYFVKSPERVLPMSSSRVYARGIVESVDTETRMYYGQFGIQTANHEVKALIEQGTKIRVQQNVIGDYAECTDITGGGVALVRNGEAVDNTSNMDTHPRTCVGIKADGTLVFMTVDGRQAPMDMNGMAYNELSATMLYYGCDAAYNLDGGGSTTFLTRNQFGDFDVQNSPSDGGERHDSNSLLIVVPEIQLLVNNVSDTEVEIDYREPVDKNVVVSDIKINVNGKERVINEYPYVWTGLDPLSKYDITASYNISYKDITKNKATMPISITTGNLKPYVENSYYYVYENKIVIHYNVLNPANINCLANISSGRAFELLNNNSGTLVFDATNFNVENVNIKLGYNLNSSHSKYTEVDFKLEQKSIDEVKKNVLLNSNGGELNETELKYVPGIGLKLPTPIKEGYIFEGWFINGKLITEISKDMNEDLELIAQYKVDENYKPENGCAKRSAGIAIATLSAISLLVLVFRRKK